MEQKLQPSSPGKTPVDMKLCMEEVVKFTLESHINQTLEFNLPISKDFCFFLLQHFPLTTDSCDDESQYPLYKCLASALYKLITCTASCETCIDIDSVLKKREEWSELILKEGSEIVKEIHHYGSFSEMLQAESLAKVLPGIKTIDEGVQVYRKFYAEEEKSNGVLAICVAKSAAQPYLQLDRILSGLSYEGLQSLLGLTDQAGTTAKSLSPAGQFVGLNPRKASDLQTRARNTATDSTNASTSDFD